MDKSRLVAHLHGLLQERLAEAELAITSTRSSFASDTKSSAGDKHETGRAMVQQELDKLEDQRAKLLALQHELDRVPLERVFDRVAFGSLVRTDQGTYFISIGLGRIAFEGAACFVISLASPIGQLLKDKPIGDLVVFQGKPTTVLEIQ